MMAISKAYCYPHERHTTLIDIRRNSKNNNAVVAHTQRDPVTWLLQWRMLYVCTSAERQALKSCNRDTNINAQPVFRSNNNNANSSGGSKYRTTRHCVLIKTYNNNYDCAQQTAWHSTLRRDTIITFSLLTFVFLLLLLCRSVSRLRMRCLPPGAQFTGRHDFRCGIYVDITWLDIGVCGPCFNGCNALCLHVCCFLCLCVCARAHMCMCVCGGWFAIT